MVSLKSYFEKIIFTTHFDWHVNLKCTFIGALYGLRFYNSIIDIYVANR